jgi:hypothetical protein
LAYFIGKSGVIEFLEDFNTIHKIFYENDYAGNTVLSQVGQRGQEKKYAKNPIIGKKIFCPMLISNERTNDCLLKDFLFSDSVTFPALP